MNTEHLPIIQAIEEAAGCPMADLPDDSEWWAVYDELINELNEEKNGTGKKLCVSIRKNERRYF